MLTKTITYTDYNGVERKEDFYFNLTKPELMEMQVGTAGGFAEKIKAAVDSKDQGAILNAFKEIILKSYGEKSEDGKRFIKVKNGERLSDAFAETEAYAALFMELCTDEKAATAFINAVVPAIEQTAPVPTK